MAIPLTHRVGEGARIYTPCGYVDVIVKKISGTGRKREVDLAIMTEDSKTQFHLTYNDGEIELVDDVVFRIRPGVRTAGSLICLDYSIPKDHQIDQIQEVDGKIMLKYPDKSQYMKK
ncbi:MAG: hypothetical protein Q8N99_08000 [Nanoarchaeota archaeon]|nr:hypothetical protein [Nanoarchaeota archaeon]